MNPGRPEATVHEEIPGALAGQRLDRVVAMVTGVSRADANALIADGQVLVNDAPCTTKAHRLAAGDALEVAMPASATDDGVAADPRVVFPVVHEDDDLIVVDKPPGLVVHPGAGNHDGTLVHGLLARYPELAGVGDDPARPGIVHRLDKDTSGLLVVARTPEAHTALVEALADRVVERAYVALAWGHFEVPSGLIDAPIGRSSRLRTRMAVSARGREARTGYEVRHAYHEPVDVTLLDCHLETGRTHQIRVHLAAIGHPVVGDERYGGDRTSFPVPRMFLHAAGLRLVHPTTGEELSFTSPLPGDLTEVLTHLA